MVTVTFSSKFDSKKYDRQLRIWGEHGQLALSEARICLLGATATGTEILKNLILPGIGSFTVVDDGDVTVADVGNNFFLSQASVGKSRGEQVTEYLLELNNDVAGDCIQKNPASLLRHQPTFFDGFAIVVASGIAETALLELDGYLAKKNIPLIVATACGLVGCVRIVANLHYVVEAHPANPRHDLRLDCPFAELIAMCDSVCLDTLPDDRHRHIPYPLVLLHYLRAWRAMHGDALPTGSAEQSQFKATVVAGKRRRKDDPALDEENFEEAERNVRQVWQRTEVPPQVVELFSLAQVQNPCHETPDFFIVVRALADFVANEGRGQLPVTGTLPDMAADSETYAQLQKIYRAQANRDMESVRRRVRTLLTEVGRPVDAISDAFVRLCCKNAAFFRIVRNRPIHVEVAATAPPPALEGLAGASDNRALNLHLALRGARRFQQQRGRWPGTVPGDMDADMAVLRMCARAVCADMSLAHVPCDDSIREIALSGGAELHSIAAVLGGVAAQEIIKIITHQFVPSCNTLIFDGIDGRLTAFDV